MAALENRNKKKEKSIMGLDMYLTKRVYVKNWSFHKPEQHWTITARRGDGYTLDTTKVCNLVFDVAYWRKANAIHKWFVDNVQDGKDECQESYIESSDLRKLLELAKSIVKDAETNGGKVNPATAHKTLPTQGGFFFGSTDYDEYYLEDMRSTVKQLEIALGDPMDGEFYYHASW